MSYAIPIWALPIAVTALLWTGVSLWPIEKGGGDYNFAPAFDALLHMIVGVIGTLLIWLLYFALT